MGTEDSMKRPENYESIKSILPEITDNVEEDGENVEQPVG